MVFGNMTISVTNKLDALTLYIDNSKYPKLRENQS